MSRGHTGSTHHAQPARRAHVTAEYRDKKLPMSHLGLSVCFLRAAGAELAGPGQKWSI